MASGVDRTATIPPALSAARRGVLRGTRTIDSKKSQTARNHPRFVGVARASPAGMHTQATQTPARSQSRRTRWRNPGRQKLATARAVTAIAAVV
jgi:hypothetical protein